MAVKTAGAVLSLVLALFLSAPQSLAGQKEIPPGLEDMLKKMGGGGEKNQALEAARMAGVGKRGFSLEQEYYLGRGVAAMILSKYKPLVCKQANAYLNMIGQLAAFASEAPETFAGYHFIILDTDEVNGLAAPGGLIFVTKGLVRCCGSEDGLAAILAHEVAHVQHRHGIKSIKKSRMNAALVGMSLDLARRELKGKAAEMFNIFEGCISDVFLTLVNTGYAREMEYEADKTAVDILKRLGYDPRGLVQTLLAMEEKTSGQPKGWAKTHPDPGKRYLNIRELIGGYEEVRPPETRRIRFKEALKNL